MSKNAETILFFAALLFGFYRLFVSITDLVQRIRARNAARAAALEYIRRDNAKQADTDADREQAEQAKQERTARELDRLIVERESLLRLMELEEKNAENAQTDKQKATAARKQLALERQAHNLERKIEKLWT